MNKNSHKLCFGFMSLACLRFLSHAKAPNELGTSRCGCYKLKKCFAGQLFRYQLKI